MKSAVRDFSSFADSEVLATQGWRRAEFAGGDYLWRQGTPADTLMWLQSGTVRIVVDGAQKASVPAGDLLGEASLFTGENRTADVQATERTVGYVFDKETFDEHRRKGTQLYDALLLQAAKSLSDRIHAGEGEVARRRDGELRRDARTGLTRPERTPNSVPTAVQSIAHLPRFQDASPTLLLELASVCNAVLVQEGDALCRQGDRADAMFIVAEGELTVTLETEDGNASRVGTVGPGALLGTAAIFIDSPRSASLVATQNVWLWELPRDEMERLSDHTRRALLESLVVVLRGQLIQADIAALESRGARGTIPLEDAMGTFRALQAYNGPAPLEVDEFQPPLPPLQLESQVAARIDLVRRSVIGNDVALPTPFGQKRVVYADYTASGRSLTFIEDFIREQVMPLYANTHTEASASGLQTTAFREEARELVAAGVGATVEDAVIFTGSGATGAIDKLIGILNLRLPPDLDKRYDLDRLIPSDERPVVFVGPYEHHSNILSWRHTIADVRVVPLDRNGMLDTEALEGLLLEYATRPLKIGSFSAASNVTGIKADTIKVATLLHRHGALSFWDYAAAGPYVDIEMNPTADGVDAALASKDAVFISPHKFVGGPGTPGVLVLKRDVARNTVPAVPGGGTVDFVTWVDTLYTDDLETREEGGTPAILESIRCGLVFQLKDQIGTDAIQAIEHDYTTRATQAWRTNPALELIGNADADRLSITAFLVRYGQRFLHYGFVVALLNDLFGIQARGGCSCAGPYGAMLLGLSPESGNMFLQRADEGWMSLKPGWSRVNFNYFIGEEEFRYIIESVHLVAAFGWALLPSYDFDPRSGLWTKRDAAKPQVRKLKDLSVADGTASWRAPWSTLPTSALQAQLRDGREVLRKAMLTPPPAVEPMDVPDEFERTRWFPLPHEAVEHLRARQEGVR